LRERERKIVLISFFGCWGSSSFFITFSISASSHMNSVFFLFFVSLLSFLLFPTVTGLDDSEKYALISIIQNVAGLPGDWNIQNISNACGWEWISCSNNHLTE